MKLAAGVTAVVPGEVQWLKRVGAMGFLFFLAKGLLWLGAAAAFAWFGASG
jgi:hypothetical protein